MIDYDLEEQQEPEQFTEEQTTKLSKEVYKRLKEQKKVQKQLDELKKKEAKHIPSSKVVDNKVFYICDNCSKEIASTETKRVFGRTGEYAYCLNCFKELYPEYKVRKLSSVVTRPIK